MALSKEVLDYIYNKIDSGIFMFGRVPAKSKPSDVCKKYRTMTEEDILEEIAAEDDAKIANLDTVIARATTDKATLVAAKIAKQPIIKENI